MNAYFGTETSLIDNPSDFIRELSVAAVVSLYLPLDVGGERVAANTSREFYIVGRPTVDDSLVRLIKAHMILEHGLQLTMMSMISHRKALP